jgi:hypothetical protein
LLQYPHSRRRRAAVIITCYTETLQPQKPKKPNSHVTHKPRNIATKDVLPFGDDSLTSSDSHLISMASKNQPSVVMQKPHFVVSTEIAVLLHTHTHTHTHKHKHKHARKKTFIVTMENTNDKNR